MQDHYEILGVSRNATQQEITAAYKAAVKKYHPDRHHGNDLQELAQERLKSLNEAYEVLSNPQSKAWFDRTDGLGPAAGPSAWGTPQSPASQLGRRVIQLTVIAVAVPALARLATNPKGLMVLLAGGSAWWLWRKFKRRK